MGFLANSFYDGGLQFPAVGTAKVKFIAVEANGDAISGFPFAGDVTIGGSEVLFPGVDHAIQINDDRAAREVRSGFTENFGLGLIPVFDVVAFDGSALPVQLRGAASDGILQFRRSIPGFLRHTELPPVHCARWIHRSRSTQVRTKLTTKGRSGCQFGK